MRKIAIAMGLFVLLAGGLRLFEATSQPAQTATVERTDSALTSGPLRRSSVADVTPLPVAPELARNLMDDAQYGAAIEAYKTYVEANPSDRESLLEAALAIADWEANKAEALRWLERAADQFPDDELLISKLADALVVLGRQAEAETVFQRLADHCQSCGAAHIALGDFARDRGDTELAFAHFERASGEGGTALAGSRRIHALAMKTRQPERAAAAMAQIVSSEEHLLAAVKENDPTAAAGLERLLNHDRRSLDDLRPQTRQ